MRAWIFIIISFACGIALPSVWAGVPYAHSDEYWATSCENGTIEPYWECTFKRPAYINAVLLDGNMAAECWWSAAGYDGTRLDRGMEACSGNSTTELRFLEDGWYGMRIRIPSGDYPTNKTCIILQLFAHGRGGSWTGTLEIENNKLSIVHRSWLTTNHTVYELDADIERDTWIPIIIYWKPSTNPAVGKIRVWYDGAPEGSPSYDYTGKVAFDAIDDGNGGWLDGWVDEDTMISGIGLKWGMYCADAANYTSNEVRTIYYDDVSQLKGNPVGAWELANPQRDGRDAFSRMDAEYYSAQSGVVTTNCSDTLGGLSLVELQNSDWVAFYDVNFGAGANGFEARVASTNSGTIEVRLGSATGTLLGSCPVSNTGGTQSWASAAANIATVSGKQNVYLKFTGGGGNLLSLNWFKFTPGAIAGTAPAVDDPFDDNAIGSNLTGIGSGFNAYASHTNAVVTETNSRATLAIGLNGGRRASIASKDGVALGVQGRRFEFRGVSFTNNPANTGTGTTDRLYLGVSSSSAAGDYQANPPTGFYLQFMSDSVANGGTGNGSWTGTNCFFYEAADHSTVQLARWTFDSLNWNNGTPTNFSPVLDITIDLGPAGWALKITGDTTGGSAVSFGNTYAASGMASNELVTGHGLVFGQMEAPGVTTSIDRYVVRDLSTIPPVLGLQLDGNQLRFNWPATHTGWRFETQTNALSTGLGTNWVSIPGSTATNQVVLPMGGTNGSVFFRLAYP